MIELKLKSYFFFHHRSWRLIHSNKPDLLALVQSGAAFLPRIGGEWSLRQGSGLA